MLMVKQKKILEEEEGEEEEVMINELYKDVPALEDTTPQRRKFVGTEKSPASQQYISSAEDSDGEEEIKNRLKMTIQTIRPKRLRGHY